MVNEDEDIEGDDSQSQRLKRIRNIEIKGPFGSWNPNVWTFSGVIVIAVLFLLTIMLLLPFGLNPINRRAATVRSNSMEPTFSRGDVVFVQEIDPYQIEEGDVIVLQVPDQYEEQYGYPPLIVHRVTDVRYNHLFDMDLAEDEEFFDFDVEQPVPEDLKERFDEENYYLNNEAMITPETDGEAWITVNGEREYRLEETDDQLRIFDARPAFETQGDAEDQEDPFLTPPQNIIGEYSGSRIPYLGLLFMFANTPMGMATLSLSFLLVVIAVYFPWHIDIKEERTRAMSTLGSGLDALHRRLNDIEETVGDAAGAVGEAASGLIVSRTTEGKIGAVKKRSNEETEPENIMMRRDEPIDVEPDVDTSTDERSKKDADKEIDLRPLNELHKAFQKGDLSVEDFIEIRKDIRPENKEDGKKEMEIDLRPLNELNEKFRKGEVSVEEFLEQRKELER